MNTESAAEFLSSLQRDQKLRMLARLSHSLTIVARDTYDPDGGVTVPSRLRALNEVQHHTSSAVISLIDGRTVPPDEAIAAMYLARRDDSTLSGLLAYAFESSAAAVRSGAERLAT